MHCLFILHFHFTPPQFLSMIFFINNMSTILRVIQEETGMARLRGAPEINLLCKLFYVGKTWKHIYTLELILYFRFLLLCLFFVVHIYAYICWATLGFLLCNQSEEKEIINMWTCAGFIIFFLKTNKNFMMKKYCGINSLRLYIVMRVGRGRRIGWQLE